MEKKKVQKIKSLQKQAIPQDKMTSPRYMDALRNKNEIIPLQLKSHTEKGNAELLKVHKLPYQTLTLSTFYGPVKR